uniref:Large ribosomal subunit protein bL35m n=1 Tax=Apteryx owenii TaxID=8824 RepID=A0A8B9S7P6_APTOW
AAQPASRGATRQAAGPRRPRAGGGQAAARMTHKALPGLRGPLRLAHLRGHCGPGSVTRTVTFLLPSILQQPVRTLTYCSLRNGKRKTVKAVTDRFLRLHNGLWVRRKAGYKKKLWKKSAAQKKRLRELVLCNKTQCKLLDKMTTSFWKRRNWSPTCSEVSWLKFL